MEHVLLPIVSKINEYLSNYILVILLIGVHFCTLWIKYNRRDLKEAQMAP